MLWIIFITILLCIIPTIVNGITIRVERQYINNTITMKINGEELTFEIYTQNDINNNNIKKEKDIVVYYKESTYNNRRNKNINNKNRWKNKLYRILFGYNNNVRW